MNKSELIKAIEGYARTNMIGCITNDWYHVERVRNMSFMIAKNENIEIDNFILMAAALLHDVSDYKYNNEQLINRNICETLEYFGMSQDTIDLIMYTITNISYRDSLDNEQIEFSNEMKCLRDADFLDCLGAIGITRTFAYGGLRKKSIYAPDVGPIEFKDSKEYKNNGSSMINHFDEKLFKLKDMMLTQTGKAIAIDRHDYLVEFQKHFFGECAFANSVYVNGYMNTIKLD